MLNELECYSDRYGQKNFNLEFSKHVNINKYPLLTSKIEQISSIIQSDHLKFVLKNDGQVSISTLAGDQYVRLNQKDFDEDTIKIIKSISKIAKKMNICSLKEERYKPFFESSVNTHYVFGHTALLTKSPFPAKTFFKRIQKNYVTKFIAQPIAKKIIENTFKNKSATEIENIYIDNKEIFASIKEEIINKNPSFYEALQPEELETLINHLMLESYGKCLTKISSSELSEKKIYKLDVARIITSLQHHHLSKNEYRKLLTVSPLDIPIQELAKIPVIAENEKALAQLWTHLIGNLFVKGNLENLYPGNEDYQTDYALAYLEARSKLPSSLQKHVTTFTDELDEKQNAKNIKLYCMVNTDISQLNDRLSISNEIELYQKKVKKEIKNFIKENTHEDGAEIAKNLVYTRKTYDLSEKILETFSAEEKSIFSEKNIVSLLLMSLEKIAVSKYAITEAQLKIYKIGRNLPVEESRRIFHFNETALDSLQNGKNAEHIQMHKDLLFVSKVLAASSKKITAEDKKRLEGILLNINENKKLRDLVKTYVENDESVGYVKIILNRSPKFLHGILNRLFNPQNLKFADINIPYGISSKGIELLDGYLKTLDSTKKLTNNFKELQIKSQFLIEKFEKDPSAIQPNERLTVQELAILTKLSRYTKKLKNLNKFALDHTQNPQLQNALEMINQSHDLLSKIEGFIIPKLHLHYRSGDLLAYNASKKEKWFNASLSLEQKLTAFTSNGLTHGGKILNDKKNVAITHVVGEIQQNELDLYNICISDIYEIEIKHLFSSHMQSILKAIYGNQWAMHVTKLYVDAETAIQLTAEDKFDEVENFQNRRTLAALANLPRLARFLSGKKEIQSHTKTEESSRLGVYEEFFGDGPKSTEQICSEWASKATLAAMMEANRKIAKDLAEKTGFGASTILANFDEHYIVLPTNVRDYLEGTRYWGKEQIKTKEAEKKLIKILKEINYSSKEIELIIKIGNNEIFSIPYDRRERLKTIHPGRMVKLLAEKKCLRKRGIPPALAQLVLIE